MASRKVRLNQDKVSIIGCGCFGSSWLILYARGGYRVSVYDVRPDNLKASLERVKVELRYLEDKENEKEGFSAQQLFQRITVCDSVQECVRDSILVQECTPEDLASKRGVLKTIDQHVQPDSIIVSFAASLSPSPLSEHLTHKHNFLVIHSATEIVPSPWTDATVTERLWKILESLGRVPILLRKEIDGLVINRILHSLMAECYHLVKGGYCDAADVDTAMVEGLGLWYPFMGIFDLEHLNAEGFVDLCKKYANAIYEVQKSFLPPERMEGADVRRIHNSLCELVPLDRLQKERTVWIKAMSALQKMKDDLNT